MKRLVTTLAVLALVLPLLHAQTTSWTADNGNDTYEPYGADWPGTLPDRKDGTVFSWKVVE